MIETLPDTRLVPPGWVTAIAASTTMAVPSVNAVMPPLVVNVGGGCTMVIVNGAVAAFEPTPLAAVTIQPLTLVAPAFGVPVIWLLTRLKPLGSVQPESVSVGTGNPVTVKVPEPAEPTLKVEFEIAEMVGAWLTVSVNDCDAFGATPLVATMVIG